MIRYSITRDELLRRIAERRPRWLRRANQRAALFQDHGRYCDPPEPFWSEIKDVYRRIQYDKCAYCERKMGTGAARTVEADVEHFRPKCSVSSWPPPGCRTGPYAFSTGGSLEAGYFLLAYNPMNYVVACKVCNSRRKCDYFPIEGKRMDDCGDVELMGDELPLLLYPIGESDSDPEELIRFEGQIPVPVSAQSDSREYRRARVTIDLLELATCEDLLRERCELIRNMDLFSELTDTGTAEYRRLATETMSMMTGDDAPHASCARCFRKLIETDPAWAKEVAAAAHEYLTSVR